MKFRTIIKTLLPLFVLSACLKAPSAEFTIDRKEYSAGETVTFNNSTINATSYVWTFPDGSNSTTKDPVYIIPVNTPDGNYTVDLEVFSKNGKTSSKTAHSYNVRAGEGDLTIWSSGQVPDTFSVVVDQQAPRVAVLTGYNVFPGCVAPGCLRIEHLSSGTHSLLISFNNNSVSGRVEVYKNTCQNFRVY